MVKKTNCRNCKWADWMLTANGRKRFWNYARCTYPVTVILPASRWDVARDLTRAVGVREYKDVPVECEAWDAVPNAK